MRIAIPVADDGGMLAESFSPARMFALYDVHDDTRAVAYLGRQVFEQPGCGRTPGFLHAHGVEVLLAHQVSENALNHLREAGIVAIQDAPLLASDALIAHLVSGTLRARPPQGQAGGCGGGGGCGHCGDHAPAGHADEPAETGTPAAGGCCGGEHSCADETAAE